MSQPAWTKSTPPWFHLLVAAPTDTCDWLAALGTRTPETIDGAARSRAKSATKASFFDEVAAALQFPYYFGENWDAMHELPGRSSVGSMRTPW